MKDLLMIEQIDGMIWKYIDQKAPINNQESIDDFLSLCNQAKSAIDYEKWQKKALPYLSLHLRLLKEDTPEFIEVQSLIQSGKD